MGVVYLGISWDGSQVAVKVLRPELADDPEFRRRFRREVSALMRVKGLCTVQVIEADTESSQPFMVTEYAEGPSLAEYIDSYGLVGSDMLYGLATGLAEALTVIHAAGIVHRDFKPSNVILTATGPKVIDFGIARRQDTTGMTKTGMMVGSMGFMAPEQISGHPGPATDIFAWGVTVAYAATGRSPFGAGNAHSVLYRIMYGDPDIAAVPDTLRPLVEAALAKDPQSRPTAQQLLDRLTSATRPAERSSDAPTQVISSQTWQAGRYSGEVNRAPSPPLAESPTADRPTAGTPLPETSAPVAPAPEAPGTRKVPVGRRVATIAASAIVAMRRHRPGRRAASPPRPKG